MSAADDFSTPQEAHRKMLEAGAVFAVRRRDDALGLSFTYRVDDEGDSARCRQILVAVKNRPAIFFEAFRAAVQRAASPENGSRS